MLNGIISVLVVFVMLAIGYFFTRKKIWPDNANQVFSVAVIKIAAPALAVTSIGSRFTPELLRASAKNILIITAMVFCMFLIGKIISRFFHLNKKKKAVFEVTFTFNNAMFIGLPIIQIVFGNEGLPYLFTYYLVTIVLFWSLGAYVLSNASDLADASFSLKKIISPGLVGVILGCIIAELRLTLPQILETSLIYLGNICVPLSLFVIGSNLARSFESGLPPITGDQIMIMVGKFIISPLVMFSFFSLAGVQGQPLHVFILAAALPCHAQTAILAQYYNLESEYASNLVSLSTLISLVTIPIYASFLL